MYLIDTNVFLELLLDQKRADECEEFLNLASSGEISCVATKFSIHAVEGFLTDEKEKAGEFLRKIDNSIGIEIRRTSLKDEIEALNTGEEAKLDLDDSIQLRTARREDAAIVSFDSDFDRAGIERKTPQEVLDNI